MRAGEPSHASGPQGAAVVLRALKFASLGLLGLGALALVLALAVCVLGNTVRGRLLLCGLVDRLSSHQVQLEGLEGAFPAHLTLAHLALRDENGVWLRAERIRIDWSPLALLESRLDIGRVDAALLDIERAPVYGGSGSTSIPRIELGQIAVDELRLGAPLAGIPARLTLAGSARLRSLEDANAELVAHRSDGVGEYRLHLRIDRSRLDAVLDAAEPASGPLENILTLPGLGALSAHLEVRGPRGAARLAAAVSAGALHAKAAGTLDLSDRSAEVSFSIESPALRPRPDLLWQHLSLEGRLGGPWSAPHAAARLDWEGVRLGATCGGTLSAVLEGQGGRIAAHAQVSDLTIPGPSPRLLAADPLELEATLELERPRRPLELRATHRLFALRAHALTRGAQSATLELELPELAPWAALAGEDLKGAASLTARVGRQDDDRLEISLAGSATRVVGTAPWARLLEHRIAVELAATLSAERLEIGRFQVDSPALRASFRGEAARVPAGDAARALAAGTTAAARTGLARYLDQVEGRFDLALARLDLLAPELAGDLHAAGRLDGTLRSLAMTADVKSSLSIRGSAPGILSAALAVHGLPDSPSASLKARGMIDGAPLDLDAALDLRGRSLHALIRHASWKSARLAGEISLDTGAQAADRGRMHLAVGRIADFERIVGMPVEGHLDADLAFTPLAGRSHAHLVLEGGDLRLGTLEGSLKLEGEGATDAVRVQLEVRVPRVAGLPAELGASALLDLDARTLRIDRLDARYRGRALALTKPARIEYADGISIDRLELGAEQARLRLGGSLSPTLDVTAALERVDPALVNAFVPDLLAAGTFDGHLHLTGHLAHPEGWVRLEARGVRAAGEDATGLPAVDAEVRATLAPDAAQIDAHVTAAGQPLLAVTGRAPLDGAGEYDLKAIGQLDVSWMNALLEARGMHATGRLEVDATLAGTPAAPQLHGTLALAAGSLRDYAHGLNLTDVTARASGRDGRLVIETFKAGASPGTITVSGSVGALEPDVPVDLEVTAVNAQPITSDLLTVSFDSTVHVTGSLTQRVDVAGIVTVKRALVGIPDSLPPEVAVLDVRRRGLKTPPDRDRPLVYGFDVTIQARNDVLVQGRGLDADLGGELHIGGTSEAPRVSGGFDLQRGSFSVAGGRLTLTPPGRLGFDDRGLKQKIDPTLDFTAQSTVIDAGQSVTATLKISGFADAPKFDFSSSPDRPLDQVMALLLFGQPASQLSALQVAEIGAALATLTGAGGSGANPLVRLQRSLGLDRLSVGSNTTTTATGATENSGAAIAAGRYVAKRVYVEAKQTTTGQSQVQVDVDLTKHLKLETRLGNGTAVTQGTTPDNDPGSSIGLSYQFEY